EGARTLSLTVFPPLQNESVSAAPLFLRARRSQHCAPVTTANRNIPLPEIPMKLFYAPGTCALSPHIVLREAELPYSLVKVDLKSKRTADGEDYTGINPKGYVPTLELDDGTRLTEGPAIV